MDQGLINLRWAFALVDGLAAAGVRRAVISPGSRSTPLVLACDRHPLIDTRVLLDERSAGFFALGQSKADGVPTLLIATSGSAPTHWFPAVVEAALSATALVLLSADRPPELQGWGANQTLDQQHLFGNHCRAFHQAALPQADADLLRGIRLLGARAAHQATWPKAGPVHINQPFREPLVPAAAPDRWPGQVGDPVAPPRAKLTPEAAGLDRLADTLEAGPGLIICGPRCPGAGFATAATDLAAALDCPILADPLSGLRFGPWPRERILTRYDAFLRGDGLPRSEWILRFGAAPVSKTLLGYLDRASARQFLVADNEDWLDPLHRAFDRVVADPERLCRELLHRLPRSGRSEPLRAAFAAADAAAECAPPAAGHELFEGAIIRELLRTLPPGATLFSGNSQPVRQLDTWSGSGDRAIRILCNRGASGIDGNVATLLGLAAAANGPVVGLLGDLAFSHDLNSLLAAPELNAVIVVLNNGGGAIFQHLPQAGLDGFERYWLTPQDLDLEQAAVLYRIGYRRVASRGDFAPALAQALASSGVQLIECVIDRRRSLETHRAYWRGFGS